MDTNPKISGSSKVGMLSLALVFDTMQFMTQGYMDTLITAIAVLVFSMIFLEKGAFKASGTGALKVFRIVVPLAELAISNIPGIFLAVWIQIKIANTLAEVLPESAQNLLRLSRLKGNVKNITQNKDFIKKRSKKIARVASRNYGKGRRGASKLTEKKQ